MMQSITGMHIVKKLILFSMFFITSLGSSNSKTDADNPRDLRVLSASPHIAGTPRESQDKVIIEKIHRLFNQYMNEIDSFRSPTPTPESHEKLRTDLKDLKAFHSQLSPETKARFTTDSVTQKAHATTGKCIEMLRSRLYNAPQTQAYNIQVQIDLQYLMWELVYHIRNYPDVAPHREVHGMASNARYTALQALLARASEYTYTQRSPNRALESAQLQLNDYLGSVPSHVAFNPKQTVILPDTIQQGLITGQDRNAVVQHFTANPNALLKQDEEGWTPLLAVAAQGHVDMLDSLLPVAFNPDYIRILTESYSKL